MMHFKLFKEKYDLSRNRRHKSSKRKCYNKRGKNAALPLIVSSILAKNEVKINNVPNVADIKTLISLLENLGAKVNFQNNSALLNTNTLNQTIAKYDIVRKMRASILTLGPLLARFGHCEVSLPGGCAIGQRPIDLHLLALEKWGKYTN